ncbi:hypothetical protein N7G274_007450 [Stereocaulon virgatum]|uniref:CCHC-type domain-containing protein n=1 Tax=Stereocaulon virgatum TaxID=373712 RepID=A0ABR4A268_9LECA
MTAEKAKEMLLEGHRRGIDQLKEGEARALVGKFGKQQKQQGGKSTNQGDENRCETCNKPGHTKGECWEEHHELAPDWLQEQWKKQGKYGGKNITARRGKVYPLPYEPLAFGVGRQKPTGIEKTPKAQGNSWQQ